MSKSLFLIFILQIGLLGASHAQSFYGKQAQSYIANAQEVHLNEKSQQIDYIAFVKGQEIPAQQFNEWLHKNFKLSESTGLLEINRITDQSDASHIRYKLTVEDAQIHDGMIVVHLRNNLIYAINGIIQNEADRNYQIMLSETQALQFALNHVNASLYKWQIEAEEAQLKTIESNPMASYYPKATKVIIRDKENQQYHLSYRFNIYAQQPLSRSEVFVDAQNGSIIYQNNLIQHTDSAGIAATKYSGQKNIISDYYNSSFRLRETGRGLGIETYNLNNSTNYGSAFDFTDADNFWNNINTSQDEIATDAHWGMEMTYDFYFQNFNRNSIDGNGLKLISYVHYDLNYANAFWDGQVMTFGDGNGSMLPLVALDIVGHEITHGLTTYTAHLDYQDESGAMNEAYSDIFGTSIEFFAKPSVANWLMGENIGNAFRSMSNPNSYGDPDTYLGQNYYIGTADNGGVHTNCGVLSHCYYLLSEGGSGINDLNNSYSVNGLGIDTAAAIAFRALTVYLTNSSQHIDARFYWLKSATDLYGACSPAVQSVANAFYAVGIGNSGYIAGVQADFNSPITEFCEPPATISFQNLSNNGGSFIWDFGDGLSSTIYNPTHTYTSFGTFAVSLIANGGGCGQDTIIKNAYISISTNNPCIVYMPPSGSQTKTACQGTLYDSGGPNNYADNTSVSTTIAPVGASSVVLTFSQFDFETGYDYLKIYDGPSTSSTLIGIYDGTNLPNGGTITANSGSVTLLQETDMGLTKAGFVASWQCNFTAVPPVCNFAVNDTANCSGEMKFTDLSLNGPTSWLWSFGDGVTSNLQNPIHNYSQSGLYSVSLISSNAFGFNQLMKTDYVLVNKPSDPLVVSRAKCNGGVFTFNVSGAGDYLWYDSQNATTALDTGNSFTTPNLILSTSYWVQRFTNQPVNTVGKNAVNTGGSVLNYEHYLEFDVFVPAILKQVKAYASNAGSRVIKLVNSNGILIDSRTVNVVAGWNTLSLDFDLPVANGLRLVGENLYRHNSGVNFPYTLNGILSITKSSANTNPTDYYYYFYEWEIQEKPCFSNRVQVIAFVNSVAPDADFTFQNNDPSILFSDYSLNPGLSTWSFGDQTSTQQLNPQHTYLQNGTYQVQLMVDNGCGVDSITKSLTINAATGVEFIHNQLGKVNIFPNPSDGHFQINIEEASHFENLEIINALGMIVYQEKINSKAEIIEVDASSFAAGIYFVRLSNASNTANFKIIKN